MYSEVNAMKIFVKTIVFGLVGGLAATLIFAGYRFAQYKKNEDIIKKAIVRQQEIYSGLLENSEKSAADEEKVYASEVAEIAQCAMPSLVSIDVKTQTQGYDIFGRILNYETVGNGSGVIAAQNYDEILILTNYHVVENMSSIKVTFIDGESAEAEVLFTEDTEDLAIISVKFGEMSVDTLSKIRIATFGNSDELLPGEMVVAIGNALGYGQSVTVGCVSAVNRELKTEQFDLRVIQTDVAINPGNSGGALLNSRGEVVGINNAKKVADDVEGICYAIPSATAIPLVEELLYGVDIPTDQQASLGIVGQIVSREYAEAYDMPRGVYIKTVKEKSAAESAGLMAGDIIVAINGKRVYSQTRYEKIVSGIRGGSEGKLTIKRLVNGVYAEKILQVVFDKKADY